MREACQELALKDKFDSKLLNRCVSFVHLPFKWFRRLSQDPESPPTEAGAKLLTVEPILLDAVVN